MNSSMHHESVLLQETLTWLVPEGKKRILDATLGLGGHAKAMLEHGGSECSLVGLDADQKNLTEATKRLEAYGQQCTLIHANFGDVEELDLGQFDCILADLGLSSPHLDNAERGFSFRAEGPLDLRFDQTVGKPASEFIADATTEELVTVFKEYGELYKEARKLADKLSTEPVPTTEQLKVLVEELYGFNARKLLPQVFQALRIAVNDELGVLQKFLDAIPSILAPGGRIGIMSYHSLEDRMVKHAFKSLSTPEKDPITGKYVEEPAYEVLTKKPVVPTDQEIAANPRARSAKFRVLERKRA